MTMSLVLVMRDLLWFLLHSVNGFRTLRCSSIENYFRQSCLIFALYEHGYLTTYFLSAVLDMTLC